jgi:hypothetical protein
MREPDPKKEPNSHNKELKLAGHAPSYNANETVAVPEGMKAALFIRKITDWEVAVKTYHTSSSACVVPQEGAKGDGVAALVVPAVPLAQVVP